MSNEAPSSMTDQSPSAKLVYTVLKHQGPQTQKQLIDETRLAPRTVRYALTDLSDADLITESVYLPDARQDLYGLSEDAPNAQQPAADHTRIPQLNSGSSDD